MKNKKFLIFLVIIAISILSIIAYNKVYFYLNISRVFDVSDVVEINYSKIDPVADNENLTLIAEEIFTKLDDDNNLLLSFVIDSSIEITSEELGNFEHLVFLNKKWIEKYDNMSNLKEIEFDSIPKGLQDFMNVQMPILTRNKEVLPKGIKLYTYNGKGLFSLPCNVGYGAKAMKVKQPLIVYIDKVTDVMDSHSFTIPLSSSGNIIFDNKEKLKQLTNNSELEEYINEITNIKLK